MKLSNKDLIFFNKEGDAVNINLNESTGLYEGKLLFHENSNGLFKTYGLYTFEKVNGFGYESEELYLERFQLFNEQGFNYYGSEFINEQITGVEVTNINSNYYTKWIYGEDLERKFPTGSMVKFNTTFLDFNLNKLYCVVATKKDAIMIVSDTDNTSFYNNYISQLNDPNIYVGKLITEFNGIGIKKYKDSQFTEYLSKWNETDFYNKLVPNRKINVANSGKNDGVYTISQIFDDKLYYSYVLDISQYNTTDNLIFNINLMNKVNKIYHGGIQIFQNTNRINFIDGVPQILKPKTNFQILEGNNTNKLTVADIPNYNNIALGYNFQIDELVMFNNDMFVCIAPFTKAANDNITPLDDNYFSPNVTHIYVNSNLNFDSLNTDVYLLTDKYVLENAYNTNAEITVKESVARYKDELKILGLDINYSNNKLFITTVYPEKYATVNYTIGNINISNEYTFNEKIFSIEEKLKDEYNTDYSQNYTKKLTIIGLDDKGIEILINGNVYTQEVEWVYVNNVKDIYRSIDKTIRAWLYRYSSELYFLGINALIAPSSNFSNSYNDTIYFRTIYPNIPMDINVEIGNYIWEHSDIVLNNIGTEFTLNIKGRNYTTETVWFGVENPNLNQTLQNFYDEYFEILKELGVHINNYNNILRVYVDDNNTDLTYKVIVSKNNFINNISYEIIDKYYGNYGTLITSNAIKLKTSAPEGDLFTNNNFGTGQVVSINNTIFPYNNTNYNIIGINQSVIYLSYEGAFWGVSKAKCKLSPFMLNSFNDGFQGDICDYDGETPIFINGGEFNNDYNYEFNIRYSTLNSYNSNYYSTSGNASLTDISFINISDYIYVLGKDITVYDSINANIITTIPLGENLPIKLVYNQRNNLVYALGINKLYIINPTINVLINTINLTNNAVDICCNQNSGDIYITYSNFNGFEIYNLNNLLADTKVTTAPCGNMAYDIENKSIYLCSQHNVYEYNNLRNLESTYVLNETNINSRIYYNREIKSIFVFANNLTRINEDGVFQYSMIEVVDNGNVIYDFNDIIYHPASDRVIVSQGNTINDENRLYSINPNNNTLDININITTPNQNQFNTGFYGYLAINDYDKDIYLTSLKTKHILIVDLVNSAVKFNLRMYDIATKIIYNKNRQTIWGIMPISKQVFEIEVLVPIEHIDYGDSEKYIGENQYGTLAQNYTEPELIWLKTANFIRRPRFNYQTNQENKVQYVWKFREKVPEFFMFDITGEQLEKNTPYAYTGEKPLPVIYLNNKPNRDLTLINKPEFQQTVFDEIIHDLDFIDDENNITFMPEGLETFTAFNANVEGAYINDLILYERENVKYNFISDNDNYVEFKNITNDDGESLYGEINLITNGTKTFLNDNNVTTNLRKGQYIKINLTDNNIKKPFISDNNARTFQILEIYPKQIIVDYVDNVDLINEKTIIEDFYKVGVNSYLAFTVTTLDLPIAIFSLRGQSEEEDIRFKIELNNQGMLLEPKDVFIFKEYDIEEGGYDWKFINKKRKELLMIKNDIYPYIGSYKALISAINYFGYNDLRLSEYYYDMDIDSTDFGSMKKYEIPNIFTNKDGQWGDIGIFGNLNYMPAKLFNLTYDITDFEGNNLSTYSINEVIVKLQGLKKWLKEHVIPITHDIYDITGQAHVIKENVIQHTNLNVQNIDIIQTITPVMAKLKEAYLMPVNSGSTVYTCKVEFNTINNITPEYFTVEIKTYMLYNEWQPYNTYQKGDMISYFGRIFKSTINNNKIINPLENDNIILWEKGVVYEKGSIVKYNKRTFTCLTEEPFTSNTPPPISIQNNEEFWYDITKWEELPYRPVQVIHEYRTDMHNYLFTIDTNIDPLVEIRITTDNGYGQNYSDIKSYEVRSTKNINATIRDLDSLEEFKPIVPYN